MPSDTPSERTPLLHEPGNHPLPRHEITRTQLAPELVEREETEIEASNEEAENLSPFYGDYTKTQFWFLYGPILFMYFLANFDSTLMASSHPVITSYFHASNAASWLSTAFMLTSTAFQPLFGRVSDTLGRRPLYIFSLVMFAATTLWCSLAQSIGSFIAARAFCGLGAGGVMAMGSIITNDLIKIEFRGTYQAYINLFYGLGAASGAAFGGFLCDRLGWRWTFGIQVPPILILLICGLSSVPSNLGPNLAQHAGQKWYQTLKGFDLAGSFCLTLTTASLILGLNLGGNILPWNHPIVISALITSVLAAALLIRIESRAHRPVMPLTMLSKSPRANLVFSNFFGTLGINTVVFNAPLYFQAVKLDSASMSGFRLAASSGLQTVFAVSTGFFITYTGRMKSPQALGAICMLIGSIVLSSMWDGIPPWLATIFVVPPSLGLAFMFPATSISVLAVSSHRDQAVMTSTLSLWRNLGTVMGVAISSLIVQNGLIAYLDEYITGPNKIKIIQNVRKSVSTIRELEGLHQHEAIMAYAAALRLAFMSAILYFVIVNMLVLPIQLPRLGKGKVAADMEDE
ncbi:MFS general substrate transporter [Venturia nashicola]|uniref:MFS general substrate transporter n=1 Tax=Venturia nashicola TaxID=86259 RepID=A0A4Z1PRU1_9PEZI|nr:MFS general substrate transporter [Venturia nashicola]